MEKKSQDIISRFSKAVKNLPPSTNIDEVLDSIVEIIKDLFDSKICIIKEYDKLNKRWIILREYSISPEILIEFNKLSDFHAASLEKLIQNTPFFDEKINEIAPDLNYFAAFPLFGKNNFFGGVFVSGTSNYCVSQHECLFSLLGNFIGNFIENAKLFHQVEHAKKEWEDTFDSITDIVAIIDKDHNILRANKAMAAVLNKHPREIIGKKCYEIHGGKIPTQTCPLLQTVKSLKTTSVEISHFIEGKVYQVTTSPIMNNKGELTGIAHIAHDITEKKKIESQLLQMQKMESLGTLAGGIAHDFNNLLEGILGYASYLKQIVSKDSPLYPELVIIENSAEQAGNLSKQLLTFARKGTYHPQPMNLNIVVESVVKFLSRSMDRKINLKYDLTDENTIINGDFGQIEQTLINLCLNARDAMPGGGEILIKTEIIHLGSGQINVDYAGLNPKAGSYVRLSVSDTGMGMSEEIQNKIFEPFFTTKKPGQGTGLGLAMVYGIVNTHKGYINFFSEPGKGTEFKILLPLSEQKVKEKAVSNNVKALRGNETILLVDDEKNIRGLILKLLSTYGYKIHAAEDGSQAIEIFKKYHEDIDLIILDMITPNISGAEAFNLLRQVRPDINILLSSGYSPDNQIQEVLKRSQGFIQKPYRVEELLKKIREIFD